MAKPPRRPVGLGLWPAELKLIENPWVLTFDLWRINCFGLKMAVKSKD